MQNEVEEAIQNYLQSLEIPDDTKRLISQARFDLYHGPIYPDADESSPYYGLVEDQEKYPGFSQAVDQIAAALNGNIDDIYVDVFAGGWSTHEPDAWEDDDGEIIQPDYEDYVHVDENLIKVSLLGAELASYVH